MLKHDPLFIQGTDLDINKRTLVFNSPVWDYIFVPLTKDQQYELQATKHLSIELLCLDHNIVIPVEIQIERHEYA